MITQIHYDTVTMEPIITEGDEDQVSGSVRKRSKLVVVPATQTDKKEARNIVPMVKVDGKVAIVILAWNQLKYTKICIESIKKQTKRDRYDLIVVDNGSTDGTLNYLKDVLDGDSDTVIRNVKNRGFSGGNNQGLQVAECEYILMLNNDCRIEKDNWLNLLLDASKKNGVGLFGAVCMKGAPDHAQEVFNHIGLGKEDEKWSYIEGWCLFGRRKLFLDLGGFDMRFNPAYGEDADLSYRIKAMGLKIKAIDLPIKHYGSKSKGQTDKLVPNPADKSRRRLFDKWILGIEEMVEIEAAQKIQKQKELVESKSRAKPKVIGGVRKSTILLRRKGARGDVLLTTPIIRELKKKYPESFLVYETDCPDVLTNNPYVDHTERYVPKPGDYDIVLSPRYEKDMSKNAIDTMARQCGVELSGKKLEIHLTADQIRWAKNKIDMSKRYIAFHTGRAWKSKEWSIDGFKKVAQHYLDKDYDIVELGDRQTKYMALGNDCRGCSIKQSAALIKECRVFIGIDSLCAHLAKAVGTPACVIYGSVDPSTAASDAVEYPIRINDLECKGCRGRTSAEWVECCKPEVYCLTRITPEMVIETVDECISKELDKKRNKKT